MRTNNYNKLAIEGIILSCKHTENATKGAIESYIAEHDSVYGEFSLGELNMSVILDNHYDEYTGELINDNWQTTIMVTVIENEINVTFS